MAYPARIAHAPSDGVPPAPCLLATHWHHLRCFDRKQPRPHPAEIWPRPYHLDRKAENGTGLLLRGRESSP